MRSASTTDASRSVVVNLGIRLELTAGQASELRRQLETPAADAPPSMSRDLLTPDEAGPLMRHSAKSVRGLCRLPVGDPRRLPHLRKGRKILIRRMHVEEWLASQIEGA